MKTDPNAEMHEGTTRTQSLSKALRQNEHVRELVEESAAELSSANTALKHQIADQEAPPWIESALEKSEAVEEKVEKASGKLASVNRALEGEIRDRDMLDHRFAAAIEQEEAARHAAFHDVLTGLPNRALFNDRLEHGMAQAERHGWKLAVMFVDLDKFKSINDSHGHDVGDVVLQTVARRLKENTRGDDTVSRLGGDEFLYLAMEIRDEKNVALLAYKIIGAIQAPCYVSLRGLDISPSVGASIGIAIFPKDGTTADALVNRADEAMYRAKQNQSGYAFAS